MYLIKEFKNALRVERPKINFWANDFVFIFV